MDKRKKRIMLTILIVGLIQMPALALTPGINQIATKAFEGRTLVEVQSALSLAALAQPIAAFIAAMLINRRLVAKKAVILFGLCLLASVGVLAILFHTQFWHLILLSVVLGISTGCFISNMFGLIFDNFDPMERQAIVGYQTSFINAGGIMMSLMGGLLARFMWYGGYLILFIGLPAALLVYIAVPYYKAPVSGQRTAAGQEPAGSDATEAGGKKREKNTKEARSAATTKNKPLGGIHPKIYYYCCVALVFMMSYGVCGSNISTHIAGLGDSATAGLAVAITMGGGVISGIFFGRLSNKTGDYSMSIALCSVFVGYMALSIFTSSLALTFAAVFLVGMSLSVMLPRCIFMVSTYATDPSTSATATALVSIVAPSTGAFLSPIIITNLTTALFGASTAMRYRFTSFIVLALAIVIAVETTRKGGVNPPPEAALSEASPPEASPPAA